jgi:uncharacterized protein YndB with AHSA1/START domain
VAEIANVVSVTRRIPAPATRIFAVLADPARHPEIDGSGMLRRALDPRRVSGVGDAFAVAMYNDEMGDYEMTNHVVEYQPGRRITWEPVLTGVSRKEDAAEIGGSAHQRWSYMLVPDGADVTVVTETYDCTESPEWLKTAVRGGQRWEASMAVTLERLEALTTSMPVA